MFTGIITYTGTLNRRTANNVEIHAPSAILRHLKIGDSVAVSGVCLTVTKKSQSIFSADIISETWQKTMLNSLPIGALVNLELSLRASDRLSGHIVQGHVDGTAKITKIKKVGNSRIFTFRVPKNILGGLINKGSVTINGISLTIIKKSGQNLTVGIIPHTWENTSLREAKIGDLVNIEIDHSSPKPPLKLRGGRGRYVAIIASSFHQEITDALKTNCVKTLAENGVPEKNITIVDVPGALEIPLVAKKLAQKKYNALIALGVIHKGATYHFQQVADECARGCLQVSYEYEIPVIYEVLAVYNLRDARERAGLPASGAGGKKYNRGKDAAETALKMISILKNL